MRARDQLLGLLLCGAFGALVGVVVGAGAESAARWLVLREIQGWPTRAGPCVCADTDAATAAAESPLWGAP